MLNNSDLKVIKAIKDLKAAYESFQELENDEQRKQVIAVALGVESTELINKLYATLSAIKQTERR